MGTKVGRILNVNSTTILNTLEQLPINEIHLFLKDYDLLKKRIAEAKHKSIISLQENRIKSELVE